MEISNNNNSNLNNRNNNAIGKYGPTNYSSSRYNKLNYKNDHYKHRGYANGSYYNKLPYGSSPSHFYENYYERFSSNTLNFNNYSNIRRYSNNQNDKYSSKRKYYNNKFYMNNHKYNQNYNNNSNTNSNRLANSCAYKPNHFNNQPFQTSSNGNFVNSPNHVTNRSMSSSQTTNSTVDYGKLPIVALSKIYSFLNLKDRLNASLTCKQWRAGLFDPRLWTQFNLTIYLCNRELDLKSAQFKANFLLNYIEHLTIKYDPNDLVLFDHMIDLLNYSNNINLKHISIQPILNTYFYDYQEYDDNCYYDSNDAFSSRSQQVSVNEKLMDNRSNKRLFKLLNKILLNSKCIEHLSLGCIGDYDRLNCNFEELVSNLAKKHLISLKSVHLSTINNSSVLTLASYPSSSQNTTNNNGNKSNQVIAPHNFSGFSSNNMFLSNLLGQFVNLNALSLDYDDLTDQFLRTSVCLNSLKKLNLNVNSLEKYDKQITNESWAFVCSRNQSLRVNVNVLHVQQNMDRNYQLILKQNMPLECLRMYFCKSLKPDMIQFLSDNYCDYLVSLIIVDAISDPTLRYHNPLRHDAGPDPLVLLCWKCRHLNELVIVGYEILEINLIAIAKLRSNLKTFYVPMDCIIDLKYGEFKNNNFIEDEDGEDTIVDYGYCSDHVIENICKILGNQNWHPLEKDELPMCVYEYDMPYEEAYLDTLIKDQNC